MPHIDVSGMLKPTNGIMRQDRNLSLSSAYQTHQCAACAFIQSHNTALCKWRKAASAGVHSVAFAPLPSRRLPPPGQQPAASERVCVAAVPASPLLACLCVGALHPHSSSASARRPLASSQSRVASSSSSPPIACTELCHDLICTMRSVYTCPPCGIPPAHLILIK